MPTSGRTSAPLERASETVGKVLKRGDIVIYESTVYPGLHRGSLRPDPGAASRGCSSTRISSRATARSASIPGDREHRLPTIRKVTSGSTPEAADFVDKLYGSIVTAGTHKASSIRVAEAAKVIENTQRDVNIALVNELALIFNRLGIDTAGSARGGGQQVEFPAVPARARRRPLHRRRSLLPDAQGAADRLPPGDDPRRPAHQRQHGALRRAARSCA